MIINNIKIDNHESLFLIAGPCAIESEKLVLNTAETLKSICDELSIGLIFKSSFDKANRTSFTSFRGCGMQEGLRILNKVKNEFDIPVVTDVHLPEQCEAVADVVDMLQIPAFLCRQTDLLVAAAKTGKPVNIKKAQFVAPWDMKNAVHKMELCGNYNILLCERGTTFGYNNLVVDMTSLVELKKLSYPVIFDATHSVQKPGGNGVSTGGNREYVESLARAAVAIGIAGLFLETHPNPDEALSDGSNMVPLDKMRQLLTTICEFDSLAKK